MNTPTRYKIILALYTIGLYYYFFHIAFCLVKIVFHNDTLFIIPFIIGLIGIVFFNYFRLHFVEKINKEI